MRITPFVVAALALIATPAQADNVATWRPFISEAAQRFGLPEQWIAHVMRVESGGHVVLNGHPITSRAGAMGLMQLMPATWASMRSWLNLGSNPHDPHDNIIAGTGYLRLMVDRFGVPGAFGAYNAGPGRYAQSLRGGRVLPYETIAYLAQFKASGSSDNHHDDYLRQTPQPQPQRVSRLFYVVNKDENDVRVAAKVRAPTSLFITLNTASAPAQ
jgi:soluble lytic murein transglycosylase-like protein